MQDSLKNCYKLSLWGCGTGRNAAFPFFSPQKNLDYEFF